MSGLTKEQLDDMARDAEETCGATYSEDWVGGRVRKVFKHVKALAAEVERLQVLVRKLPTDADGNPIPPGADLFYDIDGELIRARAIMCLEDMGDSVAPLAMMAFEMWHQSAEKARQP